MNTLVLLSLKEEYKEVGDKNLVPCLCAALNQAVWVKGIRGVMVWCQNRFGGRKNTYLTTSVAQDGIVSIRPHSLVNNEFTVYLSHNLIHLCSLIINRTSSFLQ